MAAVAARGRVAARIGWMVPSLLRERREFRRYWTGHTISLFGDAVTLLALPLTAVIVLDATPAQVGYLTAAGLLPNLLFSVHAGAWVDRRRHRRRIMIAADLGRAGLLATIPLAYALGVLTLAQLYLVGSSAVGSLLGSLVTGRLSRRLGIGPALIVGSLLFTAPLVLVPLASGGQQRPLMLALLFAARFGTGLGVMILDICGGSIFAALIPDNVRARVNGAYMAVNYGVRPLGSLAGGLLASVIGLRPTLWIVTVGALIGVLWLLPSPLPRLRTLPGTLTPG